MSVMTLTKRQRQSNPTRYRRKDARTKILRALYGRFDKDERVDHATQGEAYAMLKDHIKAAAWPPLDLTMHLQRLNALGSTAYSLSDLA